MPESKTLLHSRDTDICEYCRPDFMRHTGPFSSLPLCLQVLPQVEQPQTGMNEGVKVGLIGIGALVALGGAFFIARKLLSSQLPKVQKVWPCPPALSMRHLSSKQHVHLYGDISWGMPTRTGGCAATHEPGSQTID